MTKSDKATDQNTSKKVTDDDEDVPTTTASERDHVSFTTNRRSAKNAPAKKPIPKGGVREVRSRKRRGAGSW